MPEYSEPAEGRQSDKEVWIFGYGSVIYKQGFAYQRRVDGYIKGWRRVFYQGSTDHRGTEEKPGRTVTIEPCEGNVVSGSAFLLTGDHQEQQKHLEELEHREKQYDEREYVDVFTDDDHKQPAVTRALTFIATSNKKTNVHYLGEAPLQEIAQNIATAVGPSGPNWEYLYKLADAMREMGVDDAELYELDALVKKIRKQARNGGVVPSDDDVAVHNSDDEEFPE